MAKYRVNVTERNYGSVTIEADSEEEACEIAEEAYSEGNVDWGKTDFQVQNIEEK